MYSVLTRSGMVASNTFMSIIVITVALALITLIPPHNPAHVSFVPLSWKMYVTNAQGRNNEHPVN